LAEPRDHDRMKGEYNNEADAASRVHPEKAAGATTGHL
jgi:hypothetical protein